MSHQPEETAGLDLFDETASAAGSFPHSMLGYERAAVDAYVRDVERMLASTKRKLRSAQRQAQARSEETDYGKLGAHTGDLLRTAETQAAELIRQAQLEAHGIKSGAQAEANRVAIDAKQGAATARESGVGELRKLRDDLSSQTAAELAAARDQALALRQAADQHRDMLLADAERAAAAIKEGARVEADRLRQAVEREAAELRAAIAKEREEALAALSARNEEVQRTMGALVATSRQQSEDFGAKLAADSATLDERRQLAMREADQIKLTANEEASALIEKAKAEAESILDQAEQKASAKVEQLRRETTLLQHRKQAILAQLSGLSSLANRSAEEFPDAEDEHSGVHDLPGDGDAEEEPTQVAPDDDADETRVDGIAVSDEVEEEQRG